MRRRDRIISGLLACALVALLQLVRGHGDWGPSEGVYALTSRLLLDGGDIYGRLVASQPPWIYLFGALPLSIHDSLDSLRVACGLLQVFTGLLAGEAVWRLTKNRVAAFLVVPLVVVTPWATHQHGLLLPEQLASPLLLGGALLAARPATARWAGVLAGVAVFTKLPFALPAAALVAAGPARWVAARWAAGTIAAQAVLCTVVFGTGFWSQIITAQRQAGGLEFPLGSWVQAGWNLLPLVLFALVAVWLRRESRDQALLVTLAATAAGMLVSTLTIVKEGTGLNVLVPTEPLLATLAAAGVVWALETPLRARAAVAAGLLGALLLAQSASLLIDANNPRPFHRPFSSAPGWKVLRTRDEIDRLAEEARRFCPLDAAYTGPQLVAFLADRPMPGDQPDVFIISRAEMHADAFRRFNTDSPRCP